MLDSWSEKGVYIWVLVAAVQATNPEVCSEVELTIDIITSFGPEQGRKAVTNGIPNVSVCLDPDVEQVKSITASILGHLRNYRLTLPGEITNPNMIFRISVFFYAGVL
jgi:inosine-uridine nucleoside N-ribohydrolase